VIKKLADYLAVNKTEKKPVNESKPEENDEKV